MKKIRVLSLDGGGIRGIIPATIMEYIENELISKTKNPNARIADYFDMIVGTSTGGILSCFYLTPNNDKSPNTPSAKYKATKALELYTKQGGFIFTNAKRNPWGIFRQFFNATKFSPKNLEQLLEEYFKDLKFSDLLKKCLITTYDMEKKSSYFFNSREEKKDREFHLKKVARSTSAAPTYFPPAIISNISNTKNMINLDGGVFANNPAMCAYAEARKTSFNSNNHPPNVSEMLIISVGTGGGRLNFKKINKVKRWNIIQWGEAIPDIMMDGSLDTVHYQMKLLFNENKTNYKRIDVPPPNKYKATYSHDMSNASPKNIKALEEAGKAALKEALKKTNGSLGLDSIIDLLIKND